MTPFQQMFVTLRQQVLAPRHAHRFEDAGSRQLALAGHATLASALAVLESPDRGAYAEKEALVRAILAEQQASPGTFWSSALLVACYPMLGGLRARIASNEQPTDELDQLVLASFLEVAGDFPLDRHLDRTFMRIRQQTRRRVFRLLAEQRRQDALLWPVDAEVLNELAPPPWLDSPMASGDGHHPASDQAAAVPLLVELAASELDGEGFDMVTATLICGRQIRCFVQRNYPGLAADEGHRFYQKIKRRHSRAVARLRRVVRGPRWGEARPCTPKEICC